MTDRGDPRDNHSDLLVQLASGDYGQAQDSFCATIPTSSAA